MKSEKIEFNNPKIDTSSPTAVIKSLQSQPPKGSILLDKSLLPSRGKFYEENIYVKKLSALSIKKLATLTEKNADITFNNMIMSSLWGIDYDKILVGDKLWFVFYLRSLTYNDLPFKIKETCPYCNTITNYDYVLKNLDISYYDNELPEYFEINGDKIEVKFPTISTEAACKKIENDPNVLMDIDKELLTFSSYIYKVNGEKYSLMRAYEYMTEMSGMDFSKFSNELSEHMFIAKPFAKFICPHCGEEVEYQIPLTPPFFMPKI